MNYLFCCDSNQRLGTGHLMRSLRIASQLVTYGHHVFFFGDYQVGRERIEASGCQILDFGAGTEYWVSGVRSEIEANKIDHVIIDNYAISYEFERELDSVKLVIDDLDREHACHAVLDMNIKRKGSECYPGIGKKFLGPSFFLGKTANDPITLNKTVEKLVFFWGGTDPQNQVERTISLFNAYPELLSRFQVAILSGMKSICCPNDKIKVIGFSDHVIEELSKADIFIGAGGGITWERISLGLPSICMSVADNQTPASKILDEMNVHRYLGNANSISDDILIKEILSLADDLATREMFSRNSLDLEVGKRAGEVIEFLLK